ncbi:MAG: TonB family protein [Prevotella sp.]|nr:TonB family protein [Prevotella sp.]
METKKSSRADLEARRPQWFLMGLVVALAVVFVGLEYSWEPDDPLDDPELLDQLTIDTELAPLLRQENELALAPKAEPKPTMVIKVVEDDQTDELLDDDEPVETDPDSDMAAIEDDAPIEPPAPQDDEVMDFRVVEDLPQFPGGPTELMKWLTRNLKYPKAMAEQKRQGRVVAEFIVNKDGSVTDVAIATSFNRQCDQEVLRVLRMMPRWTAGIMDGQPCRTKVCIPVVFRL